MKINSEHKRKSKSSCETDHLQVKLSNKNKKFKRSNL